MCWSLQVSMWRMVWWPGATSQSALLDTGLSATQCRFETGWHSIISRQCRADVLLGKDLHLVTKSAYSEAGEVWRSPGWRLKHCKGVKRAISEAGVALRGVQGNILLSIGSPIGLIVAADLFVVRYPATWHFRRLSSFVKASSKDSWECEIVPCNIAPRMMTVAWHVYLITRLLVAGFAHPPPEHMTGR